jgi:hypothetical protein
MFRRRCLLRAGYVIPIGALIWLAASWCPHRCREADHSADGGPLGQRVARRSLPPSGGRTCAGVGAEEGAGTGQRGLAFVREAGECLEHVGTPGITSSVCVPVVAFYQSSDERNRGQQTEYLYEIAGLQERALLPLTVRWPT